MKAMGLMMAALLAGVSLAVAAEADKPALLGGPVVEKPMLVERAVVPPAPVIADTNVLAALTAEEKALLDQAKDITRKIIARQKPLRDMRERVVTQDKDLQAIVKAIAEKQKELDAKLLEKYPDLATQIKERDDLTREHSDVNAKLREVRRKMDEMDAAIRKQATEKKQAK
jgi:hypothetical protein